MAKKIVIGVSMDEVMQETLVHALNDFRFSEDDQVQFIHVFEQENYVYMVPPIIYPTNEQKPAIKETVVNTMKSVWEKVNNKNVKSVDFECLFDESPKVKLTEYVKENSFDMCLIATRGKHGIEGLFTSSFAEHLIKFSPCDVLVVRPQK